MEESVTKLDEYKRQRRLHGSFVKYLYIPAEGGRLVVGVVEGTKEVCHKIPKEGS